MIDSYVSNEKLIMKNPDQYLWVHKRYKSRPAGGAKVYS